MGPISIKSWRQALDEGYRDEMKMNLSGARKHIASESCAVIVLVSWVAWLDLKKNMLKSCELVCIYNFGRRMVSSVSGALLQAYIGFSVSSWLIATLHCIGTLESINISPCAFVHAGALFKLPFSSPDAVGVGWSMTFFFLYSIALNI